MKKGFTLVELLAVIVILGIVAVITSPLIQNVIESSKMNAFKSSINSIVNIIETDYNENTRSKITTYEISNNKLICKSCDNGSNIEVEYNGELKNTNGTITDNNGKINSSNIISDKYKANISNGKVTVSKK